MEIVYSDETLYRYTQQTFDGYDFYQHNRFEIFIVAYIFSQKLTYDCLLYHHLLMFHYRSFRE